MGRKISNYKIAFLGMMLAVALVLSSFEAFFGAMLALPPGVKLGLANLATMYTLFYVGRMPAVILVVLKSAFVGLTRSPTAFFLSLCGGMLSVLVLIILERLGNLGLSYIGVSIIGSLFHNVGQLLAASLLLRSSLTLYYSAVLLVSGAAMGILTGITFEKMLPYLTRLRGRYKE